MQQIGRTSSIWLRSAATAGVIGLLFACGGSDDSPAPPAGAPAPAPAPSPGPAPVPDPPSPPTPMPPPPSPPVALPFKVMPARASLAENDEATLAVFGAGAAVTWTSSDPAVVQVDAGGAIKALARGSATITATEGARTSSVTVKVWRTEGPNADASTESLIAAGHAAGRISAEEALIYRVYAMFGDERLPAAYDGAPGAPAAVSLRHVSGQLSALSPAAQEILRPFLIPPIYAESWLGRQLGLAATPSARTARARPMQDATPYVCSAEIVNALMQAGLLVRRTTAHYNLYAIRTYSDFSIETPLMDAAVLDIETIDGALRSLLNRQAKSDAAEPCNGGDGAIDIYFADMGSSTDYGATTPYAGRCEDTPAFVLIDKYKLGGIMRTDPARGRRYLRTVLAHELTHTIQFGMNRSAACADYDWIDEATAQWAAHHVFPTDNEEDGFRKVNTVGRRTGIYYVDYLKGGHRESIEKANGYSTYIYFQFIAHKYGAASIKALFDAWTGHGSIDSLDVALKAVGSNLRDAWPEFGKALWNDVRDNVLTDLRGWDGYDYGMANVVSRDPLVLAGGRVTLDLLRANGGRLAPRSLAYERLVFPNEVSPLMLSNPLGSMPQAQHLKLIAVKKIGGQWRTPEDWTAEPTKYFCRDKVAERVEELLLIVSNSDPDPNAAPAVVPSRTPFELSASNVGCWKWTGQATVQIQSDDGIQRADNTSRGVDLVFEPPGDHAGGPMLLSVTGGRANGLFTLQSSVPPCNVTLTGPTQAVSNDRTVAALWFNPDLKDVLSPVPDRKVVLLTGTTFIDSTQVAVCNGQTTVTPAPSTGWPWLIFPLTTNPLNVSADGKAIEANVTINMPPARTIHTFKFTAMRE